MRKILKRKTWPLILCFLTPIFIMACYFAYRNMSPFGLHSILTVDLGQQYVDLFAYFRHVLLNDPGGIFYSFSKGLGGEMLGTWAYYLMSPLNLILLAIPGVDLPAGILLIILLKYGLSGLSFGYLLTKTIKPNPYLTIMWSVIYALNGWIIAYQINVMWLDGMIWLPLVILGINQLFKERSSKLFIIALTLAIITNYYMGYMITLFSIIYIVLKFTTTSLPKIAVKQVIKKLILSTMTCVGLSAWLILPTGYSLMKGKAHYPGPELDNQLEYDPLKMLSKLFNGSLDFDQLPNGMPNLFIGSVALIGFLIFLFRRQIPVRKRIATFVVTGFLILSMCYQPLDLLWHAGQFPVWYPYRFSFIFCFWIIWIAANAINSRYQVSWLAKLIIAAFLSLVMIYVFVHRTEFPFVSPFHFVLGIIFILIGFVLLLYTHNNSRLFSVALLCFAILEMAINACDSLNNLSYISNHSYTAATRALGNRVNWLYNHDKSPYRIGKTFYRSKNDPLNDNYMDGNVFDSSLEYTTPRFMKLIGQPEGRGFTTYTNGTLLSDRLLGFRYFLTSAPTPTFRAIFNRNDLQNYPIVDKTSPITVHKNVNSLPLTFTTYSSALNINASRNPVTYQSRWYHAITHQPHAKFRRTAFNSEQRVNLKTNGSKVYVKNPLKNGTLSLRINPKLHNIYYLLVNPKLNSQSVKATVNGQPLLPNTASNHALILNLNSGINRRPVTIRFKLLNPRLNTDDFRLYRLNKETILKHPYRANSSINHFGNHQVKGTFNATLRRSVFSTSIPATNGWHLKIDNKKTPIKPVANEFVGASVKPGHHTYKLTYVPPYLTTGLIITLITLLIIIFRFLSLL